MIQKLVPGIECGAFRDQGGFRENQKKTSLSLIAIATVLYLLLLKSEEDGLLGDLECKEEDTPGLKEGFVV